MPPKGMAEPLIQATLSTDELRVNQTTTLEINVEWVRGEADYRIGFPDLQLENLIVLKQGESQESFRRDNQSWIKKTLSFELKATAAGEGIVRPLKVTYVDNDQQITNDATTPALTVSIRKAPASLASWFFLASGPFILILAAAIYYFRRKAMLARTSTSPQNIEEDNILAQLDTIPLSTKSDERARSLSELDATFRSYLSRRYQFETTKVTSEELVSRLSDLNVNELEIQDVQKISLILQNAKYTRESFDRSDLRELKYEITRFIRGKRVIGEPIAD